MEMKPQGLVNNVIPRFKWKEHILFIYFSKQYQDLQLNTGFWH